jgi:hypothetical protein
MAGTVTTPDARAQRRIGAVLRGKYTLEAVLGVGGMATVYLGVHRNGHKVAVKMLHPEASADPVTRARFLREGYVANSIGHTGAVRVLDDDVDADGSAFIVMELLEGETLHARVNRCGGRLPAREALALGHKLCDVLAAAHEKGVVHRDVKPENLFLTTDRALKVLDFGIARGGGPGLLGTHAGAAIGTPAFMPPEQALGHHVEVDARSDVWSVGATLFALISGHLVHEGETAGEMLVAAATRPARSLAAVARDVPAPIVALVDRALRFAREDRWPSAEALRDGIDGAYADAFGEALAPSVIGPVVVEHALGLPSNAEHVAETRRATPRSGELDRASDATLGPPGEVAHRALGLASTDRGRRPGGTSRDAVPTLAAASSDAPADRRPSGAEATLRAANAPARPSRARQAALVVGIALASLAALAGLRSERRAGSPVDHALRAAAGCASNRACTERNGGRASVCRPDGACAALESQDCKLLAEPADIANDATIWIGSMFPLTGVDVESLGDPSRDSVELARKDFAETVGGLPPARPGGPRRPIGVVMCDDAADPARAAAHLVDDVGVPAVIGFHRSKEVYDLAASLFIPRGVLVLAANTAPMLRSIPHPSGEPRLVYRTTTSGDMINGPVVAMLADVLEPELRAVPGLLGAAEPVRVLLVRVGNASGLGTADDLVARLRWNGKSVAENGVAFHQVVYADESTPAGQEREVARVVAEIVAQRPHVVIGNMQPDLPSAVERAWPSGERFRPRYLDASLSHPAIREAVKRSPELRRRVFGIDIVASTAVLAKFVLRHNEVFARRVTAPDATPAPYDAFYVAAYAAAAASGAPVMGRALARALPRLLPPGEPVDVGPGGMFKALAALGNGRGIDLGGAMTSLDFDATTGDATADFAVLCLAPGKDGALPEAVESGLVFRANAKGLTGTLRCP